MTDGLGAKIYEELEGDRQILWMVAHEYASEVDLLRVSSPPELHVEPSRFRGERGG